MRQFRAYESHTVLSKSKLTLKQSQPFSPRRPSKHLYFRPPWNPTSHASVLFFASTYFNPYRAASACTSLARLLLAPSARFLLDLHATSSKRSMSLALKRACPFTLTIHRYDETHALLTMDPGLFAPRHLEQPSYQDWDVIPSSTMTEDAYSDSSQRSPSPPKRPRNTKNLSLSVPLGSKNSITSAPASPFRSPRLLNRRPSNLTINIHSLHRHPSTPDLFSSNIGSPFVSSPTLYTSQQFTFNKESLRYDSEQPKTRYTDPSFNDIPYEESIEREKAYPDGPRLILEPNIWLYAEPDLQLAKTYDFVVNVAREVENPFLADSLQPSRISPNSDLDETTPSSSPSTLSNPSPSLPSSVSSSLSPQLSNKPMEVGLPMPSRYDNVEYLHIPWDHNSTLSQELPGVVDLVLERSEEGKKVLVHCQVTLSRKAF